MDTTPAYTPNKKIIKTVEGFCFRVPDDYQIPSGSQTIFITEDELAAKIAADRPLIEAQVMAYSAALRASLLAQQAESTSYDQNP